MLRDGEAAAAPAAEIVAFSQGDHDSDSAEADCDGRPMDAAARQRQPQPFQEMIFRVATSFQTEEVARLVQHEERTCADGEADDDAARNIARQIAETEQCDPELNRAH